jgi:AcrR family transcriptional regulator
MALKRSESFGDRRDQIIQASAELFEKVGYHGASMQMVADAVKLGKPTLYYYFKSKTDILYAVHESLIVDLRERHVARVARKVPLDAQLLGICTDIFRQIDEHPGYTRAFFEHHDELDDSQKSEMRRQRNEYLDMVSGLIAAGVKSGLFAKCEPRLTALGFLGMCNFAYKWYPREKQRTVEATAQALCKVFLEGLFQRGRLGDGSGDPK